MGSRYIIRLLSFFFLIIVAIYVSSLSAFAKNYDGWIIGDWLINFQEGFVRRGLMGYLIIKISDIFGFRYNYTTMWIQLALYIGYMGILFYIILKKNIDIWFFFILLSPLTLLFPILSPNAAGRKEIILFFLFALFILCLHKKPLKSNYLALLFSFGLLISTLFHELVFFYVPYFVLALYLKCENDKQFFDLKKIIIIISGSFLAIIPVFLFGKNISGHLICEGLINKGASANVCLGILSWPKFGVYDSIMYIWKTQYLPSYGGSVIIGVIPFLGLVKSLKNPMVKMKSFIVVFVFLVLFSSPLFILALDWGRWINIHFVLLLFTSTLLLQDKSFETNNSPSEFLEFIPNFWKLPDSRFRILRKAVFFLMCIVYMSLWSMPHYGRFSVVSTKFYAGLIDFFKQLFDIASYKLFGA